MVLCALGGDCAVREEERRRLVQGGRGSAPRFIGWTWEGKSRLWRCSVVDNHEWWESFGGGRFEWKGGGGA
jgi:hypothetical protein